MNDFCALVAYKEPTAGAYFRHRNLIEVVNNWLRNFPEADIVVTEQIRSGTVEQAEARCIPCTRRTPYSTWKHPSRPPYPRKATMPTTC